MLNICWFQLLKCKDFLPFLSFMIVNEESFGFGLLVGQKKESSHESIMRITVSCSPTTEGVRTSPLSLPQTCSSCLVRVVEAHTRTHSGVMLALPLCSYQPHPCIAEHPLPTHTHWQAHRQIHSSKRSHASISLTAAEHSSEQGGEFLLSSPGIVSFRLPPKAVPESGSLRRVHWLLMSLHSLQAGWKAGSC